MNYLIYFLLAATAAIAAPLEKRTPPNIPSANTARSLLSSLGTRTTDAPGYSRSLFPHWIPISGNCDTRETVLKRDGTGVVVGGNCYPTSGSWHSPYDGATWTLASDVDIDHVVPLSDAWKSGANTWVKQKKTYFLPESPPIFILFLKEGGLVLMMMVGGL